MDREKLKQLIVLPLIFVSIFSVTWLLQTRVFGVSTSKRRGAAVSRTTKTRTVKSRTPEPASNFPEVDKEVEEPLVWELPPFPVITEWGRNPFLTPQEIASLKGIKLPIFTSKKPLPSVAIKSIIIQGSSRVAAIDDLIVTEGEMVGEEIVVEIREDGVMLAREDEVRFVEVAKPSFFRKDRPVLSEAEGSEEP